MRCSSCLRALKEQGKTVILITHKLREIMAMTDRVSVMRRGEMVATLETADTVAAGTGRADGRTARAPAGREGREHSRRAAARGRQPLRHRCARRAAGGQCLLHGSCGRDRRHRRRRRQRPERAAGSDRRHAPAGARLASVSRGGRFPPRSTTRTACASSACCMCRRTGCAWGLCRPSRPSRARSSASATIRSSAAGRSSTTTA